ncbi:YggS family pyridoxal phosphate-dependent enzyme [Cytobacillus sp. FSL W7-1323]|uniref:Pyridoxal phosphate homeostasis protein n=1 Tax=Cytobacillus kochii TaxID=859143 RepID=A0A248TCR8_9BACI|nr:MULTISPECIES: YggS family pyridoxal phosphate-dependent enzyme [Cytobacillus]ASV66028.1 YggS family pyridoxal phosphate-dependent enzyme [Cytobacillus kochii]MDQ0184906.1 pyridoxal phosphate enzyme (YggS family) [Cytobacillus kochii]MEA1851879.1 YggS family pyridoxal phosphate-dependent enzyme [Cytobacillus sp. OWB-43]MED1606408.1 YggS family pyridoxal phosphate-dependent enzyme [Cytobacillus kochii]
MNVQTNLENIQENIQAVCEKVNRSSDEVKIIAVTKYVSTERAQEAIAAGVNNLGENRDEGLLEKQAVIKNGAVWHYIGSLQSRKVKNIINKVDYIHSLDRISLAKEIEKRANKPIKCFVQVNVSGEDSKQGLSKEEIIPFVKSLSDFKQIEVVGLMTMAPFTSDETVLRNCFRNLKLIQKEVLSLQLSHAPCKELSMGMSNDYQIAIEEGATMVRIGTALVGKEK